MTTEYPVEMSVTLRPVSRPWVNISVDRTVQQIQLIDTQTFYFNFLASASSTLTVEHFGKDINDSETAVEIVDIGFFGISDPKFAWAGIYRPDYPEPWYSQQTPRPADSLPAQTYLGWNGTYRLEFSVPVFEWMHKTLNLGWIYR
jgi:hypothetical protein